MNKPPRHNVTQRQKQVFKIPSHAQWGAVYFWLFCLAALLLGAAVIQSRTVLAPLAESEIYAYIRFLLLFGICAFAVALLVLAHLSYPRIHNLKVLVLGYLTCLCHFFYVAVRLGGKINPVILASAESHQVFPVGFYLMLSLNITLALILPSYGKYRFARAVLLSLVSVESLLLLWLGLGFSGHFPLPNLSAGTQGWLLPFFVAAALTGLSWKTAKQEYNLGGALAGLSWVYAASASTRIGGLEREFAFILEEAGLFLATGLALVAVVGNWLSRMSHRLYYDPLTQIYNREYCEAILEERSNVVLGRPSCVAMFDVDRFKKLNDTYGHATGDRVLQYVADRLSREVVPEGIACRYGGEEIIVFFPGIGIEEAWEICEAARQAIKRGGVTSGRRRIQVTISCGVAPLGGKTPAITDAMKAADKALYEAKGGGRDRVVMFGRKRKPARKA